MKQQWQHQVRKSVRVRHGNHSQIRPVPAQSHRAHDLIRIRRQLVRRAQHVPRRARGAGGLFPMADRFRPVFRRGWRRASAFPRQQHRVIPPRPEHFREKRQAAAFRHHRPGSPRRGEGHLLKVPEAQDTPVLRQSDRRHLPQRPHCRQPAFLEWLTPSAFHRLCIQHILHPRNPRMAYRSDSPPPGPPRRAVITGAGILTAHGVGWQVNSDAFRQGRVSLRPVTLFDVSRQRVTTAGEAPLPASLPPHRLSPREEPRLDRGTRLLIHAAHEALTASGLPPGPLACVLGTSAGGMALGEEFFRQAHGEPTARRAGQATRAVYYQAQQQAAVMQRALGLTGTITVISNACASGANAIAHAFSLVRRGAADAVICGGYDALSQLVFAGFDALKALSPTVARPFDGHRDGLALGEGAGVLMVESLDHARARGAEVIAEITGCGSGTDLHHLTQPQPEGDTALASMEAACRMAGLRPDRISYLNSHGTGTPLNDIAEARAISRWAGGSVSRLPVSSTKGGIGHLLGGAGAVEAIICLMALRGGFLPPCVHVETPDPACLFDLVREPRDASVAATLTNSFGFGGSNASLIFQRLPD